MIMIYKYITYDFGRLEKRVPVASEQVPVASEGVPVASKRVPVVHRRVLMRYELHRETGVVRDCPYYPDALAEAAMLQMQQHAPREAVLKLANSWKHSPRRALAYWIWYQTRPARLVSPETSPAKN